ncbi:hypothetical protein C9374_009969 [Naegleria lovaniensis]|uniref:OTU domain-containing protein n=1 Tax=Naegleria lovaniensis TaxID=51637 RepID=A0AA88GJI6_NAELO|nr:uncharacterized protein C9374_009969 [Naegleria lovaniensis]KAG2375346.1 hypothetical protein C9374_009969 [Naegleria lovaniensis]
MTSLQELESRHQQEIKQLEEEREAELQKLSGAAKKKYENKWKERMQQLKQTHETELWEAKMSSAVDEEESSSEPHDEKVNGGSTSSKLSAQAKKEEEEKKKAEQRKQKNAKKKQKKVQKQQEQRLQAEQEFLNDGGVSQRDIEIQRIQQYFENNWCIHEIDSDGHCLYRSLADQLNINLKDTTNPFTKDLLIRANNELSEKNKRELKNLSSSTGFTYLHLRSLIANQLRRKADDYFPFVMDVCETMDQYADTVEHSSEWGGQVEIQAFLDLCQDQFVLKIVQDNGIVTMGSNSKSQTPEQSNLIVTYHKKYYALGEHYNSIRMATPVSAE